MTFEVSATINYAFRYAGNVDAESYEEAFSKAQSILENSLYNENSVELLMPIAKAESIINEWITEAAARFESETGTEINPDILLDRLSDCEWIWSSTGWTENTAYEECINLTSAKKQLDRITNQEIEFELEEQETSERYFTDGDTLLDMDAMRYQYQEAKKLGETEATRLAEYIDEWLTDFFSTREISKEEYTELLNEQEEPDWIDEAPNYDKYPTMTPEEVLVAYNID